MAKKYNTYPLFLAHEYQGETGPLGEIRIEARWGEMLDKGLVDFEPGYLKDPETGELRLMEVSLVPKRDKKEGFEMTNQPDFSKPVDVRAFLSNKLGLCGCVEHDKTIATLKMVLGWAEYTGHEEPVEEKCSYEELFKNDGAYYLIVSSLDRAGLLEHGISIRYPFLSNLGVSLLDALRKFSVGEIEDAKGVGYDELWYPGEGEA